MNDSVACNRRDARDRQAGSLIIDGGAESRSDRYYDDFYVAAILPPLDATLYPNQSAELRTDGIFREDTGGTSYAPAPHTGALPRLPPSGLENRRSSCI